MVLARTTAALLVLLSGGQQPEVPHEEMLVWRTALRQILINEGASPEDVLAVAPRTYFPHELVEEISATATTEACAMTADVWRERVASLARINRSEVGVRAALQGEPQIVFGTRPEHEDFIGLSRVLFLDDGEAAMYSVSLSNWAGAIVLEGKDGDGWRLVDECAEWASY